MTNHTKEQGEKMMNELNKLGNELGKKYLDMELVSHKLVSSTPPSSEEQNDRTR